MKKILIISLLIFVICSLTVLAAESLYDDEVEHYFVLDDTPSLEDIQIMDDLLISIEFEGFEQPDGSILISNVGQYHIRKSNSDVSLSDLEDRVTVLIYEQNALTIIGEYSTANHVLLSAKIINLLRDELRIPVKNKRSDEITDDDLIKFMEIKSCQDSDDGENIYVRGFVTVINGDSEKKEDYCNDNTLIEYFCVGTSWSDSQNLCSYGCENGRCLSFVEEDEEIKFLEEEEPESSIDCPQKTCTVKSEQCFGTDKIIVEECKLHIQKNNQCDEIISSNSRIIKDACEEETEPVICQGCTLDEETCLPFGTRINKADVPYYCDITKKMMEQTQDKESCQNSYECTSNNCKSGVCSRICEGCLNENNVCIPFGTRTETQYCDVDYSFKEQKFEDITCNNNYECSTNICVDNTCISSSFLQKILDWFKRLFGG